MFRSEPEEALVRKNTCKPEEAVVKEYLLSQKWLGEKNTCIFAKIVETWWLPSNWT